MTVALSQEQKTAVERLTLDIPAPREMVNSEVSGIQREALDGYAYGERIRYDSQGRKWEFYREPVNNQWQLTIKISFFGIPLGGSAVRLDVVAGSEGENAMLERVEQLCVEINEVQAAAVAYQQALQTEADQAVAPLIEPTT